MQRKRIILTMLGLSVLSVAARPAPTPWNVDTAHTTVSYSVRHFFTPVQGQFDRFEVDLVYDRVAPEQSTVRVTIPVASINTGNERRDTHLRSGDFFEVDKHPNITFVSERVTRVSDSRCATNGRPSGPAALIATASPTDSPNAVSSARGAKAPSCSPRKAASERHRSAD